MSIEAVEGRGTGADVRAGAVRGVLFDKDGTLIDYEASWAPINRTCAALAARGDAALGDRLLIAGGYDPETDRFRAGSPFAAGTAREIAEALIAGGAAWEPEPLTVALDTVFREASTSVVPVTDLAGLFAALSARGLRLGIASSDNEASIRRFAAAQGIDGHLDYVAGYDSGQGVKPGPGMALGFLAATGLAAEAIAVVGDNLHDMHMGRSAGAGFLVGVLTGTGGRDVLAAEADVVLDSIAELPRWLASV
ncbi:HAD family hydrolase [Methyloraptor flagellatus]|jgi:phosphoglycolate phosphatase|uniref:phosphoglycolate phosphatase n=1 Tax=Methyloraptor flagellatus TaxID=3162530 RepID=A0AAU7X903_9HYPH